MQKYKTERLRLLFVLLIFIISVFIKKIPKIKIRGKYYLFLLIKLK